jgi:hypothetical protein
MLPCVLVTVELPASQVQATQERVFEFNSVSICVNKNERKTITIKCCQSLTRMEDFCGCGVAIIGVEIRHELNHIIRANTLIYFGS